MSVRSQLTQAELDELQKPVELTRDELASTCAGLELALQFGFEDDPEDQARLRATRSALRKLCAAKRY